jgi:hypothetical protein
VGSTALDSPISHIAAGLAGAPGFDARQVGGAAHRTDHGVNRSHAGALPGDKKEAKARVSGSCGLWHPQKKQKHTSLFAPELLAKRMSGPLFVPYLRRVKPIKNLPPP